MVRFWFVGLLILVFSIDGLSQVFELSQALKIVHSDNENLNASWSPDGQKIAFQTNRNGSWDIYLYDIVFDSVYPLVVSNSNTRHPAWFPNGESIVFDSDTLGVDYLFVYQLENQSISPLFKRKIQCKEASFPPSPRQVYFTGFDKVSQEWQIYSYDFVYDNLNQLTHSRVRCSDPQVAPDGKHVAFHQEASVFEPSSIPIINWYGEETIKFDSLQAYDPCWHPSGLKVYFVSDRDEKSGELYSIWKNETHLERLTFDKLEIQQPSLSPDGRYLVLTVVNSLGSDLVLIDLEAQY